MKRGAIVLVVVPGDFGKPRPAVVVQADRLLDGAPSLSLCPLTSELRDAPAFRIDLAPRRSNGLKKRSQVMIDKIQSVSRERVRESVGRVSDAEMAQVDSALRFWLGLG